MTIWALLLLAAACDPAPALKGRGFFEQGRFADAEAQFRLAVEQPCGLARQTSDRIHLAAALREQNQLPQAAALLDTVSALAAQPAETQISYWNGRALIDEHAGRLSQAEAGFQNAKALLTSSTPVHLHLQVAANSARLHLRQGHLREAEEALLRVQTQPGWRSGNVVAYDLNLAELRRLQGRPREAESILRPLLGEAAPVPAQLRGAIANNLANLAARRGAHREAETLWEISNRALREAYGPRHPAVAKGLNNQAAYLVSRKRYDAAEALYRQAIAMQEDPLLLNNLAVLLHQRARLEEAEDAYLRAVRLYEQAALPGRDALQLYGNLALLAMERKRPAAAIAYFRSFVRLLPLAVPADEIMLASYLRRYEKLLRSRQEAAEAERVAVLAMRYRVRSALRVEN